MVENAHFCIIATQIQELLATSSGIPYDQIADLDKKLVDWYEQLPSLLTNMVEAQAAFVSTIQQNIKWRYLNDLLFTIIISSCVNIRTYLVLIDDPIL